MDALKIISEGSIKAEKPQFNVGDTVRVDVRIKEGDRERIQAFEGTVIAKKHGGVAETFTVRRVAYGVGIERVFPINSPFVEKVTVIPARGKSPRKAVLPAWPYPGKLPRSGDIDHPDLKPGKGTTCCPFFLYQKFAEMHCKRCIFALSSGSNAKPEGEVHRIWKPEIRPLGTKACAGRGVLEWYEALISAALVLVLVFSFFFRIIQVDGSSMVPTLVNGDKLIVWGAGYTPQRGDVVIVDSYTSYGKPLVKRVIAKGGDTISIDYDAGTVEVNGELLQEDYIAAPTHLGYDVEFPYTVPEGTVFVMGDNRNESLDSRSSYVGCIDERDILGKVLLCFLPVSDFGVVK